MQLLFNPKVIAHRGASAYAPENTLIAFTKAAQLEIKWIEFDVMQASCGTPIIFHDETLNRTTNGKGDVCRYSYTYLQTLDAGSWFNPRFSGERIPTLNAVMAFLANENMNANIEIKALPGQEEQCVVRVLKDIKNYLHHPRVTLLFSSFSINALVALRKYAPDCLLGLLLHEWQSNWLEVANDLQCVSLNVNHEIMTENAAQRIKNLGKTLLCYTVNDRDRAQTLYSFGVDAVFSDAPDQLLG